MTSPAGLAPHHCPGSRSHYDSGTTSITSDFDDRDKLCVVPLEKKRHLLHKPAKVRLSSVPPQLIIV